MNSVSFAEDKSTNNNVLSSGASPAADVKKKRPLKPFKSAIKLDQYVDLADFEEEKPIIKNNSLDEYLATKMIIKDKLSQSEIN